MIGVNTDMMTKDYKPGDRVYRLDTTGRRLNIFSTGEPLMGTVKQVYPGSIFIEWDTCKGADMWHSFTQIEKV